MSKKQNLDDFLRESINSLPKSTGGGFEHVEKRMVAKNQKSVLLLFLLPFILTGLYWMGNFTEQDLIAPSKQEIINTPESIPQQNIALESKEKETKIVPLVVDEKTNSLETKSPSNKTPSNNLKVIQNSQIFIGKPQGEAALMANSESNIQDETYETSPKEELNSTTIEEIQFADADFSEEETEETVEFEESVLSNQPKSNLAKNDYVLAVLPTNPAELAAEEENALDLLPEPDVRETSKWSVTLNLYPNYTFREFKINNRYRSQVNDRYEDIINSSEKGGFAVNMGVDVRYHLGDNLFLGSGLSFIQTKITGNYEFEVPDEPVFDEAGNIYMYAQFIEPYKVNEGIIQTYRFAQIPLHVSFQPWASKKVRLIIEGGFSYIRFISADGTTIDHQTLLPRKLENMEYNKNLASLDFKVGMTYYVTPQLAFGLEPTLMYFNSSIYKENSPVYVVPWSVGVNLNLRLKLF